MSSGRPARRALLRWALRLFRREWRQQLLVLALLTVAVAAAVAGSTMAVDAAEDPAGTFGSGGGLIHLDNSNPDNSSSDATQSAIDAARQRFGTVDVIAHSSLPVPGSVSRLDVRDQDPHGPYSTPMLALREGRYPSAAGEVALTRRAADLLGSPTGAAVGSTVTLDRLPATVVGIVENPGDLRDDFALVAPGTLPTPTTYTVLVDPGHVDPGRRSVADQGAGQQGTSSDSPGASPTGQFQLEVSGSARTAVATTVFAASTLALALVGLIAAAGFVVVAQRRQRQLGLLRAIGATERHVRLVMVANGTLVGAVAALAGSGVGLLVWLAAAPAVESAANHRIGRLDLPWTLLGGVVGLAVLVATAAAWWPARRASRSSVMVALSGRPSRPRPVHRSLLLALTLVGAGVAGIAFAHPRSRHVQPLLLIAGLLGVVLGATAAAPAAIRGLGGLARRLPFAPRLALRDLARYQSRAAAALAATTLALAIAVSVIVLAAANQDPADAGNLSTHEMLVQVDHPRAAPDTQLPAAQQAELDAQAANVAAALGTGAADNTGSNTGTGTDAAAGVSLVPLDVAFASSSTQQPNVRLPISLGVERNEHSIEGFGPPYVATPALLALYGIDPASISPATDLLISDRAADRNEPFILSDFSQRVAFGAPPAPSQLVGLPPYSSAPHALVTPSAIQRHGWVTARAAWIIESPHPFSASQIKAAQVAAAAGGLAIEVRTNQDVLSTLRTVATLVGSVLALAIVAMAIGLLRGESARDVRTLTATGASARTRRALTASSAAALTGAGVLLGTVGAYIALLAVYRSDLAKLTPVPVGNLLWLLVGLPLAATLAGWLLAGREPRSFARQALD